MVVTEHLKRHCVITMGDISRRLKGLACVVTGAGSGIGLATALLFAHHGACGVVCVDIDGDAAESVAEDINDEFVNTRAVAVRADVSSESDNERIVAICLEQFGSLDVYFANAGILGPHAADVGTSSVSSFERHLRVNLLGPFLAIKNASVVMCKQEGGGSIVCTASIAAIRADVTPLGYSCSKAGVVALVRSAQDMLLGQSGNVRVNAVMPGGVMTAMAGAVAQRVAASGLRVSGYDMKRFPPAQAEEIAQVVLFLASGDSSYVKGQTIVADGGLSNSMGMSLKKPGASKSKL